MTERKEREWRRCPSGGVNEDRLRLKSHRLTRSVVWRVLCLTNC